MNIYQLFCDVNERQIKGLPIDAETRENTTSYMLRNINRSNLSAGRSRLPASPVRPLFFSPQYENHKFRLITGEMPRTNMLSANHYELECLRILALWRHDEELVQSMLFRTTERINGASFGHAEGNGESASAAIAALRFLTAVLDNSDRWLNELIHKIDGSKNGCCFYFCLALCDVKSDAALEVIRKNKERYMDMLGSGWLTGPSELDRYNILRKYIIRNLLSRLDEYRWISGARIYVSKADGRCYCDFEQNLP